MEKHVYFIRHGQSDSNADHVPRGREAKLTEVGRSQAEVVAKRVARLKIDALLVSTFSRAVDTAAIIGEKVGLLPEQHECFGEWVEPSNLLGLHREHEQAITVRKMLNDNLHDHDFRVHDEETFSELLMRGENALALLREHPATRIGVVTHGGFLRIMVGLVLFKAAFTKRLFWDLRRHFVTTNTGITYLTWEDERGWRLRTLNDQSHLG